MNKEIKELKELIQRNMIQENSLLELICYEHLSMLLEQEYLNK